MKTDKFMTKTVHAKAIVKIEDDSKRIMGKKSRAAGIRFEKKVREDLEENGLIVDKWTNNIELTLKVYAPLEVETKREKTKTIIKIKNKEELVGKLIKAKPKFIYNPGLKRRMPMGLSSGFPDFIAFFTDRDEIHKNCQLPFMTFKLLKYNHDFRANIIGVESKMDGKLDKLEKQKCEWLLVNNIFNKILIASKGIKRGEILYTEFK